MNRFLVVAATLTALVSCALAPHTHDSRPTRFASYYLAQDEPPHSPQLFMPEEYRARVDRHSAAVFSQDMQSLFWVESADGTGVLHRMVRQDGIWFEPSQLRLAGRFFDCDDPVFSPDGCFFYFTSHRPHIRCLNGREKIWRVAISDTRWSRPHPLPAEVNALDLHWQFSVDVDYSLMISAGSSTGDADLYRVPFLDGSYQTPIRLRETVNTPASEGTPWLESAGRRLFFSRHGSGVPAGLYMSLPDGQTGWAEPVPLDAVLAPTVQQLCPVISPDGRALFFLAPRDDGIRDIWWVSTDALITETNGGTE